MKIRVDFAAILASIVVLYCNGGIFAFAKGSSIVTLLIYGALFLWIIYAVASDRTFMSKMVLVCDFIPECLRLHRNLDCLSASLWSAGCVRMFCFC